MYKGRHVDFIEIQEGSYQEIKNDEIQEKIEANPLTCKQEDKIQKENEIEEIF